MQISAYLNFTGECEEAFTFYQQIFGGKIEGLFRYGGSPMAGQMPPGFENKIMHIRLVTDHSEIMGADSPPGQGGGAAKRFCMSIGLKDTAEAERIFNGLAEGGNVQMPLQQTFWAARFGMLLDRFGIPWMINCEAPK
ncbi:MAG TPA: VOC family protein [Bryobacteraceae bacterium]|jgi:PhnB protein|nr:VOC family protein [Bryobacteraceae bacterium]